MPPRSTPPRGSWWKDALTSLSVTLICVLLIVAAGELYLRASRPFLTPSWPLTFVPEVGYLLPPGAVMRDTNTLDYWSQQTANSQGFLAAEPQAAPGACRVALIGDSFVQAVQVPVEEKLASRLERLGADHQPPIPISAAAYGYGGAGQLNELAYYDHYVRAFAPQLVVLVFVANDFANNSAALEAIRSGFDPNHPHLAFARRTADGGFAPLPPDPDWRAHRLASPSREAALVPRLNMFLRTHSYFYAWVFANLALVEPRLAGWLSGTDMAQTWQDRAEQIARMPGFAHVLDGWDPRVNTSSNPTLLSVDGPFSAPDLPPVFQEALDFTGYALDQFKARVQRDGGHLVILSTDSMRVNDPGQLRFKRLEALAQARGIPLVDMSDFMARNGHPESEATFAHDGHWTPAGHQWAAQALFEYIAAHPAMCATQSGS